MARLDLRAKKGDTFDAYLDFLDEQNAPLIFTGSSFRCEIRQGAPDGKVLQTFCTQNSTLIVQGNRVSF
jgi:hypothetical protein